MQDRPRTSSIFPFGAKWPSIASGVFIAPSAAVIGEVTLAEEVSVWFGVVIRGDDHYIRVGRRTNIQDATVIHVLKDTHPTVIGADVTIGHGARLHGCTLEDACMVGISASVLDGAVVETGAVVAAGAVVAPGKIVRAGEMWAGCPARLVRAVRPEEREFIAANAAHYHGLARAYLAGGGGR